MKKEESFDQFIGRASKALTGIDLTAADQAGAEEVLKECWEEWRKRFSDNKIIAYCDIMYDAKEMYMIPAMMTFAKQKVAEAVEAKDAEMEKVREDEYQYHFYKRTKMLKVVRNFRDKVLSLKSEITESKRRVAELEELLASDSVYGLLRFAFKSPESAQVYDVADNKYYDLYEISKKLRATKQK